MKNSTILAHWASKKCASLGTINKNRYYLFFIIMLLTFGAGNAWGADYSTTETWNFTTSGNVNWSGHNSGYCGACGNKNNSFNVYKTDIQNFKNVDFSKYENVSLTIYVKAGTNSGDNSYTIKLIDTNGNQISTYTSTKTNAMGNGSNSSFAKESYVSFNPTQPFCGYKIEFPAKAFITQTKYVLTYDNKTASYTVNWTINPAESGELSATIGNSVTVKPNEAYTYGDPAYIVTPAGKADVSKNGNQFTASNLTADCSIQINMVTKPIHMIKWHTANGTTITETLYEGTPITPPTKDPEMKGLVFKGWTEDCEVASDGEGFTALTDFGDADSAKDFYAVFAEESISGGDDEKKLYSFEITTADFNGTSYVANNSEKTTTATAADGSTLQVKWKSYQVMLQSGVMQWQKNTGYIYNSTDLENITSIDITDANGLTTLYGTTKQPGSGTSIGTGNGYFQIKAGGDTGKSKKIKVTFENTIKGVTNVTYKNYITTCSNASQPVALSRPSNLSADNITTTSATLIWDAVEYANSYEVTINNITENVETTSYEVTGLTAGVKYTWSVLAKGDGTNYIDSDAATSEFTTEAEQTGGEGSTGEGTLTFDNTSKRTIFTTSQQVWTENGVTLTNNKANSTNNVADYAEPARFYSGSHIIIECSKGKMTQIVFDCNSSAYANDLKTSIGASATVSSDKVTLTLDGTTQSWLIELTAQVRMDALTVTYVIGTSDDGNEQEEIIDVTCQGAAELCTETESTKKYRVEGYVTQIATAYSAGYNNITFWMADTRGGGKVLQAYRVEPINDADKRVKVGDKVQVVGKLLLYESKPEFNTGTYTVTESQTKFDSLEELLAAITPTKDPVDVTVTLKDEVIIDFYTSDSYRNGVKLSVPYNGSTKDIEIYCKDVPSNWEKGGKLSGTLTCPWQVYNTTWELCPTTWNDLTYTAPQAATTITIADMTMEVGETKTITATITPATAASAVVYTIKENSTNAITLLGNTITANAEGKAIITATINETDTYLSATEDFTVTVNAVNHGDDESELQVTFDATVDEAPNNSTAGSGEITKKRITFSCSRGVIGKKSNEHYRLYKNSTTTFAAEEGYVITKIVFNCITYDGSASEGFGTQNKGYVADGLVGTWLGSARTVSLEATSAQVRATTITVYYKQSSGETPDPEAPTHPTGLPEGVYQKVTAEPTDWSGEYILVYDDGEGMSYVWNGNDENYGYVLTSSSNDIISGAFVTITLAPMTGGYSVQVNGGDNNGKYIGGQSGSNKIVYDTKEILNTIQQYPVGTVMTSNSCEMRFNAANNVMRFRYYSSGQSVVQLYKKQVYTRTVTPGDFGTICLPYGSSNYSGATFYEIVGKQTDQVLLGSVATLKAGMPYIFCVEEGATQISVTYEGTKEPNAQNKNGLYGTYTYTSVQSGDYIISEGKRLAPSDGTCWVNANRAYVVMEDILDDTSTHMPGRRYIGMDVQGENQATELENIVAPEGQILKVIENGQLIIIRNGEKYNVQGQKL